MNTKPKPDSASPSHSKPKASKHSWKTKAKLRADIALLVRQVQTMVAESGNSADFDAEKWVVEWITRPVPALGGKRPIELLETIEGKELVASTLARTLSGAYA